MIDRVPFRKDDQHAVMSHVNPLLPILFREAVDEGFHGFRKSRDLDPAGFVEYTKPRRAGMLYDRIAAAARYLCDGAMGELPELRYAMSDNQCATEFMFGQFLMFRLKRIKQNRKCLTTGVHTRRNGLIRSPICQSVGQSSFPFPNNMDLLPRENRVWLTVAWDLDDVEESISRVVFGVETRKHWMWLLPLSPGLPDVIASFPAGIADRIQDMRQRRAS